MSFHDIFIFWTRLNCRTWSFSLCEFFLGTLFFKSNGHKVMKIWTFSLDKQILLIAEIITIAHFSKIYGISIWMLSLLFFPLFYSFLRSVFAHGHKLVWIIYGSFNLFWLWSKLNELFFIWLWIFFLAEVWWNHLDIFRQEIILLFWWNFNSQPREMISIK